MKDRARPELPMHRCAAVNCTRRCQVVHLMCWIHWCQVPRELQRTIYSTCAAGMGADYDQAVKEAVEIVAAKEARRFGLEAPSKAQ